MRAHLTMPSRDCSLRLLLLLSMLKLPVGLRSWMARGGAPVMAVPDSGRSRAPPLAGHRVCLTSPFAVSAVPRALLVGFLGHFALNRECFCFGMLCRLALSRRTLGEKREGGGRTTGSGADCGRSSFG